VTPAERSLLLALFRWARAEGLQFGGASRWTRRGPIEQRWGVSCDPGYSAFLTIWRGRDTARDYWVASIAEAVDLVVALGIAPARFSTAYRAGWDAANRYAAVAHYGDAYRTVRPAVRR
jgi:hypothetical protein